jgi:hypothetical protein
VEQEQCDRRSSERDWVGSRSSVIGGRAREVGWEVEQGRGGNLGVIFSFIFSFLRTFFAFASLPILSHFLCFLVIFSSFLERN